MLFDDSILVGKVTKSRSPKGDFQIKFTELSADMFEGEFLIIEIDGIKVPFKISEMKQQANTLVLKFEESGANYDDIVGCDVYCRKEDLNFADQNSDELNPQILKGFEVYNSTQGKLGKIVAVDTSTVNIIITVEGEKEILLPLVDEFIDEFNVDDKILRMTLPEGITGINDKMTDVEPENGNANGRRKIKNRKEHP